MTHRLIIDYAKNYCNRALILKVIVENVVTCFLLGHSVVCLPKPCTVLGSHTIATVVSERATSASSRLLVVTLLVK